MPPVTVDAVLSAPATGTVGTATTVTLTTRPVQLPQASTTLPAFTQVTGAGTAQSSGMTVSGLALSGQSGASGQISVTGQTSPSGTASPSGTGGGSTGGGSTGGGSTGGGSTGGGSTGGGSTGGGSTAQIPALTASGSAIPANAGTASVQAPATLTLTPVGVAGLAFNCAIAGPSAAAVQITVTQPAATSGPVYACTITTGAHSVPEMDRIPMTLSGAGPNRVGSTDTVTLSAPGNSFGGPYPAGTSAISFSGALPVTGAQAGSVPLAGNMSAAGGGLLAMSGPLPLDAAGMDRILPPARFTVTVHAQQVSVVACVLMTTVTTTMTPSATVNVTVGAVGAQAPSTPVGAPNTGGGGSLHHASRLPALAAGTAALLAGAWFTVTGLRRRQRHFPA
jgi:hypothetical protein